MLGEVTTGRQGEFGHEEKGRETAEEEEEMAVVVLAVEVVCNTERVRDLERVEKEKAECVPTWSVWSWGKLHSTVGSRGN